MSRPRFSRKTLLTHFSGWGINVDPPLILHAPITWPFSGRKQTSASTTSGERSMDNELPASLTLSSLRAAVVQVNSAFYKATCAGGELLLEKFATRQPSPEQTICFRINRHVHGREWSCEVRFRTRVSVWMEIIISYYFGYKTSGEWSKRRSRVGSLLPLSFWQASRIKRRTTNQLEFCSRSSTSDSPLQEIFLFSFQAYHKRFVFVCRTLLTLFWGSVGQREVRRKPFTEFIEIHVMTLLLWNRFSRLQCCRTSRQLRAVRGLWNFFSWLRIQTSKPPPASRRRLLETRNFTGMMKAHKKEITVTKEWRRKESPKSFKSSD